MTTSRTTRSADGTLITSEVTGGGPGLVVVPGGGRAAQHYRELAAALADDFTVHVMNRRGRGGSGPHGLDHSIETECADLAAVAQAAGAEVVFGHSFGGLVVLEYALRTPELRAVAAYDPAVPLNNSLPLDWTPKLDRALSKHQYVKAMALTGKHLQIGGPFALLPIWLSTLVAQGLFRGEEARAELAELMRTLPYDFRVAKAMSSDGERYRAISQPTLLLHGDRSPRYLQGGCAFLERTIPHAQAHEFSGVGHNAPDLPGPAAAEVAASLRDFLVPAVR
ncbi:alpha/beta fold hydrolase [Kribbella sp. NPDC058245]|uniref:alpha/beta fold hydrolase n=1 Tax=Kribbella sp. NPDC058245 TaxID=3346399 RepID=UPI0036E360E9